MSPLWSIDLSIPLLQFLTEDKEEPHVLTLDIPIVFHSLCLYSKPTSTLYCYMDDISRLQKSTFTNLNTMETLEVLCERQIQELVLFL